MAASLSARRRVISFVELLDARRCGHATDAQAIARLVDEVDRLVREVAVGQIAVSKIHGGDHA